MDGDEHSFPLPETEAHKLEEVKEVLEHPHGPARADRFIRANPWLGVALAGVAGLCCGLWLRRQA